MMNNETPRTRVRSITTAPTALEVKADSPLLSMTQAARDFEAAMPEAFAQLVNLADEAGKAAGRYFVLQQLERVLDMTGQHQNMSAGEKVLLARGIGHEGVKQETTANALVKACDKQLGAYGEALLQAGHHPDEVTHLQLQLENYFIERSIARCSGTIKGDPFVQAYIPEHIRDQGGQSQLLLARVRAAASEQAREDFDRVIDPADKCVRQLWVDRSAEKADIAR